MNKSIRLHHPLFSSCNYVVELPQEMLGSGRTCNACSTEEKPVIHRFKNIHLRLDSNGDVFVSEDVYKKLQQVPTMAGLEVVDGRNAPDQVIGAVELPTQEIINANERFYVPGRTKYQSRDRLYKPFEPVFEKTLEDADRKKTAKLAKKRSTFIFGKRRTNG